MRVGTTCTNTACKAVSIWQGLIFALSEPPGWEHHRTSLEWGSFHSCQQVWSRMPGGVRGGNAHQLNKASAHAVLGVVASVISRPHSCKRLPESLLLIVMPYSTHGRDRHMGEMPEEQFPPALVDAVQLFHLASRPLCVGLSACLQVCA